MRVLLYTDESATGQGQKENGRKLAINVSLEGDRGSEASVKFKHICGGKKAKQSPSSSVFP